MKKGLLAMQKEFVDLVYPEPIQQELQASLEFVKPPLSTEDVLVDLSTLQEVEVLFSGWGGLHFNQALLEAAPNLKIIFHAAGSIKPIVSEAFWERDIKITSAYAANAVPVAEYTLSQILFSFKNGWHFIHNVRKNKQYPPKPYHHIPGGYGTTVGIISLSTIGRMVNDLLQHFDVQVIAYDPYVTNEEAKALNVKLCSLEDIFSEADIVSLHTPLLPETTGMIKGEHFERMKPYAKFINTARGAIIKEDELIHVLKQRPDLTAVLDVTYPEPPSPDSPLYELPNVILTPHIAGSEGRECGRMGAYMLSEFKRYINGEPLKWEITKEKFQTMA